VVQSWEVPVQRDRMAQLLNGFRRASRVVQRSAEVLAMEEIELAAALSASHMRLAASASCEA